MIVAITIRLLRTLMIVGGLRSWSCKFLIFLINLYNFHLTIDHSKVLLFREFFIKQQLILVFFFSLLFFDHHCYIINKKRKGAQQLWTLQTLQLNSNSNSTITVLRFWSWFIWTILWVFQKFNPTWCTRIIQS